MKKKHTTFRLSPEARKILAETARAHGLTMTALLETKIREWGAK